MARTNGQRNGKRTVTQRIGWVERSLTAMSALLQRSRFSSILGQSFGGKRDIYDELGYEKFPTYQHFVDRYCRQDIAKAIVDAPVRASWRKPPAITESEKAETPFEKQWDALLQQKRVYHYLSRVDRLAALGEYAVLLLGFDGDGDLSQEVTSAQELLYLTPYTQESATIDRLVEDASDPLFGLPARYRISIKSGTTTTPVTVHASRVIHVAEDRFESELKGTPQLLSVLNRLQDLELVAGASAEAFWKLAFPGLVLNLDPDAGVDADQEDKLSDEADEWEHGMRRVMRLTGMDAKILESKIADPSKHIEVYIDLIAAATRIPKRILLGSERGELASSQDQRNWAERIDERRREHCEPMILRPLIDRLITVGILEEPEDGYTVDWPDLMAPSDREQAEVGKIIAEALARYMDSGADLVVPPSEMLLHLGFTKEEIDRIDSMLDELQREREALPADDADDTGDAEKTPDEEGAAA